MNEGTDGSCSQHCYQLLSVTSYEGTFVGFDSSRSEKSPFPVDLFVSVVYLKRHHARVFCFICLNSPPTIIERFSTNKRAFIRYKYEKN